MNKSGNVILVTGGGSGIGRGLAESLHALGNKVIISGRRADVLQETVAANPGMDYLTLDQGDAADIARFSKAIIAAYPDLNVLINNAGIQRVEDLTTGDTQAAAETMKTNFLGPVRLIAGLLPFFLTRPKATIANVTSGLALVPRTAVPTYSASKAALRSYTQSLRDQLRNSSVSVVEIVPPLVQTALQGAAGFNPNGMPLKDYVAATLEQLVAEPEVTEIIIDAVKPLRQAEREGRFDTVFRQINPA